MLWDVAKAFDKVWINGPTYKLTHIGQPNILLKTLCNFLDDRNAKIKNGSESNNNIEVLSGEPQYYIQYSQMIYLLLDPVAKIYYALISHK